MKSSSDFIKSLQTWLKDFSKMTCNTSYFQMSDEAAQLAEQLARIEEVGVVAVIPGYERLTEVVETTDFSDLPVGTKIYAIRPEK